MPLIQKNTVIQMLAAIFLLSPNEQALATELGAQNGVVLSNYRLVNPGLKVVGVDADPKESFLALQVDSAGRLYAGGREALFVYEPAGGGLYKPRRLLYRFPKNSWIGGIAIRGADLYVSTHTAVYVLAGAVVKRGDITPKRLLWGLPMLPYYEEHQGMHELVIGPEGDLYVTIGDNLVGYGDFNRADHWGHWTFFHGGKTTPITTAGAVLRLSPDGERLTVVARGLRNCCGLAFDAKWNLFGNDNDHESLPSDYVPGRLIHITPHAYFSWPRGWLVEKQSWRADLLDTLNPELGRFVPTAQIYYDDAFLDAKFRENLYVAEWGKGMVLRYPLSASGASFKAPQIPFLFCTNNIRPVGLAVGRGGRIFVSSLEMKGNEASPVCRSEIVMITRDEDGAYAPFFAYEETEADAEKLFGELENPSWHRRYRAHVELMRRGGEAWRQAVKSLNSKSAGKAAQGSLVWLAAAGGETREIERLASSSDEDTRLQTVRALSHFGGTGESCEILRKSLSDGSSKVAHAALIGLFDKCLNFPQTAVCALAESSDSFLRQTAIQLLAEKATLSELQQLSESDRAAARLAGTLALGFRLTVPNPSEPLPDDFPLNSRWFAAEVQYAEGAESLATQRKTGVFTIAEAWARRKRTVEEQTIFGLLERQLADPEGRVAKQAAFFLRLLKDERVDAKASALLGIATPAGTNAPLAYARSTGATEFPEAFRGFDWEKEATRGNAKKGEELFSARGCVSCHSLRTGDKGGGGPSLEGAGSRFNAAYLAESIMVPNKTVAPMYRWTLVRLKDGEEVAGLVTGETAVEIHLLLPAAVQQVIKKSEITQREIQERSPMPEGLIQTPGELRDLLAFLVGQK